MILIILLVLGRIMRVNVGFWAFFRLHTVIISVILNGPRLIVKFSLMASLIFTYRAILLNFCFFKYIRNIF